MSKPKARIGLAVALVVVLVGGIFVAIRSTAKLNQTTVTGYFANTNGMFVGDEVRILGVPVGTVEKIEPQAQRVKVVFAYDDQYAVPADAKAVILSPNLVTARAIQLTPAYTGGPVLQDNAVIPLERTAVPVEFDDLRRQLQKLTETLQPTEPGGVSTLGAFINTTADNLRGRGASIRDTVIELSQALSALGDHSTDLFSSLKNLSILVSALQDSHALMRQLNRDLAAVTGMLSDSPNEVGQAAADIDAVAEDVRSFVADNRESLGTTTDKLASVSQALVDIEDDIEQTLHIAPTSFQNFLNIYQPAQATVGGALAINNFSNPITFLCGAIQAASRLGAEQSSKLCAQYLAPIIKNRQFNYLPIGANLFVGATARPNEVTYSEDWLRPDYIPPSGPNAAMAAPPGTPGPNEQPLLPAEAPGPPQGAPVAQSADPSGAQPTNPADGLEGLMVPHAGGPS